MNVLTVVYNAAREARAGEWRNSVRQVRKALPTVNNSDPLSVPIARSFRSKESREGIFLL